MEMWINPISTNGVRCIVGKPTVDGGFHQYFLGFGNNELYVGITDSDVGNYVQEKILSGSELAGWHHLAVVVEGADGSSQVTVYLDGNFRAPDLWQINA